MISEVVVVSGLPRSGTSLMMQMLTRGGIEAMADYLRAADDDNPAGYYEFEPVKKLKLDAAWLAEARSKAVKVVSQLLCDLPNSERYAVVFMQRDIEEVLMSQERMLARHGRPAGPHDAMRSAFVAHLSMVAKWLGEQSNFRVLRVNYSNLVNDPTGHAKQVNEFLGGGLNIEKMASAVNPLLYRNRSGS